MGKKIMTILGSKILLNWAYVFGNKPHLEVGITFWDICLYWFDNWDSNVSD